VGAARFRLSACLALALISLFVGSLPVGATTSAQPLPFEQHWTDTTQITTDDDWSNVPGVIGYRGDDLTTTTGTDPQTILADGSGTPVDVIANQTAPNTLATGGVAEFQIADPAVALNGSGTADAPHLVVTLATTGLTSINVSYSLRDLDGSIDDAVQAVALQYRVGTTGSYVNLPAGFVPDATQGGAATLVTPVSVTLPDGASNQPIVQVRVITTNAVGNDEWVGVDDIVVTGSTSDVAPSVTSTNPADGASNVPVDSNITVTFSEPVNVAPDWFGILCGVSGPHLATESGGPETFTLNPDTNFAPSETCAVTIKADHISDQDGPPDAMATNKTITFTTASVVPKVVINEVDYDQPSTDTAEFLELKNTGATAVDLDPFSVELVNGVNGGAAVYRTFDLPSFSLAAGDYYVICANPGTVAGCDLDAPVDTDLIQNGPPDAIGLRSPGILVDAVSYEGSVPGYTEGSGVGVEDNAVGTAGISRCPDGGDTDQNNVDFKTAPITPGAGNSCAADDAPSVSSTDPAAGAVGVAVDANVTVNFSEAVNVAGSWYSIICTTSGSHTAAQSGGSQSFTLNPDTDFVQNESCTVTVLAANVTDQDAIDPPDNMAADFSWTFATVSPPVAIHEIQGASHTSPKAGQVVSGVSGIVTAKRTNGYYMQDPNPDANEATSEGIFVFTSSAPDSVNIGDAVRVNGTVVEFRPGGAATNLTQTEISSPTTTVVSTGNDLPPTTVIGSGGRLPPGEVIEDDATGDVETSGVFDPAADGIDFYESLEGMRAQVNAPVVVGPTNQFREIWVLADNGAGASVRTARGGIVVRANDFNPERIQLDDDILEDATPTANVGDHLSGSAVGIFEYNFGNPELNLTTPLTTVSGGLTREATAPPAPQQVAIATFNVENLDPGDGAAKFNSLAGLIVNNLKSPDVIALEEVQDNNGATNNAVTDANVTLDMLAAAVVSAGGPSYNWRQINPVDDQDGGEPGGNIRVAFFYRTDRGVEFVDRPGGGPTIPTTVVPTPSGPQLSASPGRIDPANGAWTNSRKPLAAEFRLRNRTFFVIANHFNSKGGDQPLFGRFQPPHRVSEVQRKQQATVENAFIKQILAADPNANIVTLGDFNDFEFSDALQTLRSGGILGDFIETLPPAERYSYVFEGNSQSLDHILASNAVFGLQFQFDEVHVNAEFAEQSSDHDPSVLRLALNSPPKPKAGGPYSVDEGGHVPVSATADDLDGDTISFAWDLDGNGTFESSGSSVTFNAGTLDGPGTHTITVRATDSSGDSDTDTATVQIVNVAPSATFNAPASSLAGFSFALSLTGATDPSAADTTAGFQYAFDCGDGSGYSAFGAASSATCSTSDTGTRNVRAKIRDKDESVREYVAAVELTVTFASLCDLVRAYTDDQQIADQLCQRLDQAQKALNETAKEAHLAAFRDRVDKSGAFTPAEADTLNRLSTGL
jgi:predicted extracellular nuclease